MFIQAQKKLDQFKNILRNLLRQNGVTVFQNETQLIPVRVKKQEFFRKR